MAPIMKLFTPAAVLAVVLVTAAVVSTRAGQGQAPAGAQGAAAGGGQARGRGTPPPPPDPQAGHPTGKLVIWGDIASFDQPGTAPTHCILASRFKRGQRVGIRMTAIDGGSGETENTAVLTVHVNYMGMTIDVPTRWRGVGNFPASEYSRQPSEMWTGAWNVPADAPIGTITYTVTATDRFGRTATFSPFINLASQIAIVE